MYFEDNSVKSDRNAEIDVRQFQTEYLNFGSFVDPPIAGGRFGNSRATIERPEAGVGRTTTDVGSRRSLTVQPTSLETPRLCIIKETTGATVDRGTRTEGLSQLTQRGRCSDINNGKQSNDGHLHYCSDPSYWARTVDTQCRSFGCCFVWGH